VKKVTIRDIAREANVSVGTVSKYLNGRTDMREDNRKAISEAIERLDYSVNMVARTLAHKPIKIGVLLSSAFDEYFNPMEEGIRSAVNALVDHKVSAVYSRYAGYYDDQKIIDTLDSYIRQNVNGIILAPSRYYNSRQLISRLEQAKIPVVLMVSDADCGCRLAHVGIDARLSGAVAADLAGFILKENEATAVFVGGNEVTEHKIKAESYCASCRDRGIIQAGIYETQDDPRAAYQLTEDLLRRRPDLKLIYVATGNSVAVCQAIYASGRQDQVKVIATDIPRDLYSYVESGMVIGVLGQHLHTQGEVAVKTLYNYLAEGTLTRDQIKIAPELMLRSAILNRRDQQADDIP